MLALGLALGLMARDAQPLKVALMVWTTKVQGNDVVYLYAGAHDALPCAVSA
jgi:hypothetical protein